MEDKYIEKFHNGMSKADRDKIAQRCFIYDKYFEMFKKFIRFKAVELQDINTGYIKARDYYRYKCLKLMLLLILLNVFMLIIIIIL